MDLRGEYTCRPSDDFTRNVLQIDFFGLVGCIHQLLFFTNLSVRQCAANDVRPIGAQSSSSPTWTMSSSFKRYWRVDVWSDVFSTLLNRQRLSQEDFSRMKRAVGEQFSTKSPRLQARLQSITCVTHHHHGNLGLSGKACAPSSKEKSLEITQCQWRES
jgi:hypothetical protein